LNVSSNKNPPTAIFENFLLGLIALDQEAKRPENRPPQYQNDPDAEWGVEFWQLQQYIVELAIELIQFQPQFDELEKEWVGHGEYWGRYLGTAAIQYARHLIEDPDFEDEEFAMDWFFFHMKEDGE
jgi:hypothetical protein